MLPYHSARRGCAPHANARVRLRSDQSEAKIGGPVAEREKEYRGISYSVVRTGATSWEWSVSLGAPTVLKMGEAASELLAAVRVRQLIDEAL
jgi:hypothetical protein